MYITNVTNDYDNLTADYINNNCTDNGNNIEIVIPLITIIPCGMSLVCLISLMVYTLINPLIRKKNLFIIKNEYGKNSIPKSSS